MLRDAASVQNEQLEQLEGSLCCLLGKSLLMAWMPWVIYPIVQTYGEGYPALEKTGANDTRLLKEKD